MPASFHDMLIADYRDKSVADVLDGPLHAFRGLSPANAGKIAQALGITTIREFAQNRYVHRALALLAADGQPGYDPGPPSDWEELFAQVPGEYLEAPDRFFINFGPVFYRGRLDGTARILVLGQDPASDEALAKRNMVGAAGQRLQGLLHRVGITRSYVIFNAFAYSINGHYAGHDSAAFFRNVIKEPWLRDFRNRMLEKVADSSVIACILAFGEAARDSVQLCPRLDGTPVIRLPHPTVRLTKANGEQETWGEANVRIAAAFSEAVQNIADFVPPDDDGTPDPTPFGSSPGRADIPRYDLPFGVPDWFGAAGNTTGSRAGSKDSEEYFTQILWKAR